MRILAVSDKGYMRYYEIHVTKRLLFFHVRILHDFPVLFIAIFMYTMSSLQKREKFELLNFLDNTFLNSAYLSQSVYSSLSIAL